MHTNIIFYVRNIVALLRKVTTQQWIYYNLQYSELIVYFNWSSATISFNAELSIIINCFRCKKKKKIDTCLRTGLPDVRNVHNVSNYQNVQLLANNYYRLTHTTGFD